MDYITDPDLSMCLSFVIQDLSSFCDLTPVKFKFHNDLKEC